MVEISETRLDCIKEQCLKGQIQILTTLKTKIGRRGGFFRSGYVAFKVGVQTLRGFYIGEEDICSEHKVVICLPVSSCLPQNAPAKVFSGSRG